MQALQSFRPAARETGGALLVLTPEQLAAPAIFRVSPQASARLLDGVLEKESVHRFHGDRTGLDMRTRLGDTAGSEGRRAIFAWRDPTDQHSALISVQTALTTGMPDNIHRLLKAEDIVAGTPNTATFYSISNWGRARGVGEPFLGAVVDHIRGMMPNIERFCTLSPMPAFRQWVLKAPDSVFKAVAIRTPSNDFKHIVANSDSLEALKGQCVFGGLQSLAAFHVLGGLRSEDGKLTPHDRIVAGFHQGRGAVAERLCTEGDPSPRGWQQSFGFMINFSNIGDEMQYAQAYRKGEAAIRPQIAALLPSVENGSPLRRALWASLPSG